MAHLLWDSIQLTHPTSWGRMAVVTWALALSSVFALGLSPSAMAQTSPDAVRAFNQGVDVYAQGNRTQAKQYFERAVQLDPNYGDAHYNLGSIYFHENRFSDAATSFSKTLSVNPRDAQARYNLGLCYEKLNRLTEAKEAFGLIPKDSEKFQSAQTKIQKLDQQLQAATPTTPPSTGPVAGPVAGPAMAGKIEAFATGFAGPTGLALNSDGLLFVANYSKNSIYRVERNGQKTIIAEGGGLMGPMGLAHDARTGNLYVANYLKNNILCIPPTGQPYALANGVKKPYNLLLDARANVLYVTEQEGNSVVRIQL